MAKQWQVQDRNSWYHVLCNAHRSWSSNFWRLKSIPINRNNLVSILKLLPLLSWSFLKSIPRPEWITKSKTIILVPEYQVQNQRQDGRIMKSPWSDCYFTLGLKFLKGKIVTVISKQLKAYHGLGFALWRSNQDLDILVKDQCSGSTLESANYDKSKIWILNIKPSVISISFIL